MLSQMEFVRRVDIQEDTLEKYIQDGKIQPDLVVPISKSRVFKYFKEEKVKGYANQFGWTLITDSNRKDIFLEMIERMDMNYSYKPVFILAMLENSDKNGRARIEDIVAYFRRFYQQRRENGLIVEKPKSVYCKEQIEDAEIRRNILAYPFRRFELMSLMRHTKTLGIIEIDATVWKRLEAEEVKRIIAVCNRNIAEYYEKLGLQRDM